jgi:hypothetical protein
LGSCRVSQEGWEAQTMTYSMAPAPDSGLY